MNKRELVDFIATNADLSKGDASKALDAALGGISKSLADGDDVRIAGFGSFMVKQSAAREGRNPKTGEAIQIRASKRAAFKAGKSLNDMVKG